MFNRESLNVSSMNYADVEDVAKAIEINGEVIYDSLNNIRSEFLKMQDAGFAGSTLTAVIEAMDKVRNVPEEVQAACRDFAQFAYQAVNEVRDAEAQNAATIDQLLGINPMEYEVPAWAMTTE